MKRRALLIGNQEFDDPGLAPLKSPVHDVARLADLLKREAVGGFIVEPHCNISAQQMRVIIQRFCDSAAHDDQNLIFLSGHGIKDRFNTLHFAARDTQLDALNATAVDNKFFMDRVDQSPASQQIIFIDTCYSGSINRGTIFRSARQNLVSEDDFRTDNMVGKAIITASTGSQVARELELDGSFTSAFTNCLFEGIAEGAADKNNTGVVRLGEMFAYISAGVRRLSPEQSPQPYYFGLSERTVISLNPRRRFDQFWEENARKRISFLYSKDILSRRIQNQVFELLETLDQREATDPALKLIDSLLTRKLTHARFIEAWYQLPQLDFPSSKFDPDHSAPEALADPSDDAIQAVGIHEVAPQSGSQSIVAEGEHCREHLADADVAMSSANGEAGNVCRDATELDSAELPVESQFQPDTIETDLNGQEEDGEVESLDSDAPISALVVLSVFCLFCMMLVSVFRSYDRVWIPFIVTAGVFTLRNVANRRRWHADDIPTLRFYLLPLFLAFASMLNLAVSGSEFMYYGPYKLDGMILLISLICALYCFLHDYVPTQNKSAIGIYAFRAVRAFSLILFFNGHFLGESGTTFTFIVLPLVLCYIEIFSVRWAFWRSTPSTELPPIDPRDF